MVDQSLRGFLDDLEARGDLHRITRSVDPRFEIGAILALRDRGPAQLFQNVAGHALPLVGNLFNGRDRIARALGVQAGDLDAHCQEALRRPVPPRIVATAPVQEVVRRQDLDLGRLLPVPHWFEREAAPYITAGVIVAKDPETGRRNVSIARLRLEGGARLLAGIARNHHLAILAEKARSRGRSLEIAVAIGNHAAVLLGSQMYVALGEDEFDIAGGLLGAPVDLVACKTVDLEVPAAAEIVLEGVLDPDQTIPEGPVSEFPGFYVDYGPGIGVEIRCVTQRHDAIYQAILPGLAAEHCLLGAVAIGATLTRDLRRVIPAVRRVFVTEGGMGRLHAVIAMHRPRLGEGKCAALLAFGTVNLLKLITVVDDDIDPEDSRAVEWSLAARFRGHEDLIVLPGVKADRCDPVHENLVVTKVAMVATTRPGDGEPHGRSEFARPPRDILDRVTRDLASY
ncbi:MAG: UbiD family decarboxylase [Alphaproteobacteria bacterium]|nr:UbiD family decarboxylase [Alphaproteobacteria bacterium]